ncbi:hypothetical protein VIGAN_03141600 [Vigna angularis var. angularis]|uniref:Uncharacterized protein n=1 Tax=Vigna angularis var. angularis TaxID=157739 RepID=A0A0S3RM64_PHAAN|nr:hypothetical protein VIGAN_03141600 [Vigna angularis var. angularis]
MCELPSLALLHVAGCAGPVEMAGCMDGAAPLAGFSSPINKWLRSPQQLLNVAPRCGWTVFFKCCVKVLEDEDFSLLCTRSSSPSR